MGKIIDGKEEAKKLKEGIKSFIQDRLNSGLRVPCLATILVGDDGGSIAYINNQVKLCNTLGLQARPIFLDKDISQENLINVILELNNDANVDGIMMQVPLPRHLNEKQISSMLSYNKDVDGLTDINMGKFYKGEECFVPCTPRSVMHLIKGTGFTIEGKHAVVVGRSNVVGKPVAQLLLGENATVTICHSRTKNLAEVCRSADILVCALGKPGFITKDFIKEGAVVIDVGTSMVEGKIKGDVVFEDAMEKAAFVTPVPGGVGAVTTTLLLKNTCEAMMRNVY